MGKAKGHNVQVNQTFFAKHLDSVQISTDYPSHPRLSDTLELWLDSEIIPRILKIMFKFFLNWTNSRKNSETFLSLRKPTLNDV